MSPEQAKGRNADQRSDIFSFSAVLYEMITGRSTFDGETVTDVIAAVLKQDGSGGALFWQRADGSGTADELAERPPGPGYGPTAVSPDGKTLLFRSGINGGDIWKLSLEGAHEPESLISSVSDQRDGYFSPDGRWIVYTSSETGQPEVFVQPFPPTGEKHKITSTGATAPLWSPDGKQILYTSFTGPVRQLLSVDVRTQPSFGFSNPIELPIDNIAARGSMLRPYDIAPDGKEFVVIIPDSDVPAMQTQIHITLNWFEDLK
jgi:serine/threonine protein kinase